MKSSSCPMASFTPSETGSELARQQAVTVDPTAISSRFKAALRSLSISMPQFSQQKTRCDSNRFSLIVPQQEQVLLEG